MFQKIIWATDGSDAADEALPFVKGLASANGASVMIVHSEEWLVGPGARGAAHMDVDEDETIAKIKRQGAQLSAAGLEATTEIVGGSSVIGPAHRIAEVAAREDADLIVVGTRGHTPLGGLLLGSVTQRLLHVAPCPVLAIPAGTHPKDEETMSAKDRAAV
jgi:nucleotide-binding universal stress UspA family protein